MKLALRLAARGRWSASPNPMVGAVVVRDGVAVGSGWHRRVGTPHAEAIALQEAGALAQGSTVFVTLEPCAHHGRTPPCTEALIDAGVARVVAAVRDPDPRTSGKGIDLLRAAGIDVAEGLMEEQARGLERGVLPPPAYRPALRHLQGGRLAGRQDRRTGRLVAVDYRRESPARRPPAARGVGCDLCRGRDRSRRRPPAHGTGARGLDKAPLRVIVDSQGRTPAGARALLARRTDDGGYRSAPRTIPGWRPSGQTGRR